MKRNKSLLTKLLNFTLVMLIFLGSAPGSAAQTVSQGWSDPVNLSMSGAATNPVMVVDLRGTIHAIWLDDVDGYKYSQSSDDGITWSTPQTVKFPFGPKDPPPVLLADVNGSIHLFWIGSDGGLFYGQATPFDFGDPYNWKTTSRLARDVMAFDVVIDVRGALHIAYVRNSSTDANPAGIYYKQSIIGGGFWSDSSRLYETEYFRSAKQKDVYVRISTSNSLRDQKIFVTWDNRAQKRVFLAVSQDSGSTWGEPQQIKGPDDTGGIDTPFNLTVSAFNENVLLIWQAGEPGSSKCTVYSQWSEDGGKNWDEVVAVLGGRTECPLSTKVINRDDNYMSVIFMGQVTPFTVAWDGLQWSDIQTQTQLPSFSNPLTFDAILLGCRFDFFYNDRLYVAGCDQGRGRDVWFLSRTLEPVEKWFTPSVIWGDEDVLSARSEDSERVSNFYSTPDNFGNIHAVWVQSPIGAGKEPDMKIEYARWNGQQWTTPEAIISNLNGVPIQLMVTADPLRRLILTWIDGQNGDLVFSWANLELANLASEWEDITGLPAPTRLINSSDVIVDGSGRIVAAYVVPVNEDRGVYVTQSTDTGRTWSSPIPALDAVSASWEKIEAPRISLGFDGTLHLIFIRDTVRIGQPVGLYYSRSVDGGATWSDPLLFSEGEIQWADISSYGDGIVHVAWQEYDGLVFANVSQISQDGGVTWGKQNSITGVYEKATHVFLASDGRGQLHFLQLVDKSNSDTFNQKGLVLQDWKWNGTNWNLDLTKDFVIKGQGATYSLSAGITSTGFLGVFVPVEYTNSDGKSVSEILTFNRFLEDAINTQPMQVPVLPSFNTGVNGEEDSIVQPTATPDYSILYDDNVSTSPLQQNAVGLALVGVGVVATFILILWRRPSRK